MGKFAVSGASLRVGEVVLVCFPFSNLKGQKIRPALVVAKAEFGNLVLCQITSKAYSSKQAIRFTPGDFKKGNLPVTSYARPDKLFTADSSIIKKSVGQLSAAAINSVLKNIRELFI